MLLLQMVLCLRFLSCGCFEGVAASNKAYFADYFFLDETVFISSVNEMCGECVETRVTLASWVPKVFLACGGNSRCWPKADT